MMMNRFVTPILAATLAFAWASACAKEVNLTDHDRVELRQRADALRAENVLGRGRESAARDNIRSSDRVQHVKAKKQKKRHVKRSRVKHRA